MQHNLAVPWNDRCSPPQSPFLAFSSRLAEDLMFGNGDTIEIVCQAGLRASALRWTLCRNMIHTPFRRGEAEALPANRFRIRLPTAGLHAGFYDLRVELDSGVLRDDKDALMRRPVRGVCTFGWKAAEMALPDSRPADFAAFWSAAKARLAAIPPAAHGGPMQVFDNAAIDAYNLASACLPPDFDPQGHRAERVESGKVDFNGPDGGRVHGWLAKPMGHGPFPAMLVLPGGGFAARPRPLDHARHGYLALDLQVHGQEVDLATYPQIPGYFADFVHEPVAGAYFHNIHLRCLQAVEYLVSRPDVDPNRIVVVGGSQGGRLAVVVAGLDRRIRAAVPAIAHFGNQPYLRWAARCNGYADLGDAAVDPRIALSDGMEVAGAPPVETDVIGRCAAYYDPMNFAPDIRCPTMFNVGLVDPVSPPVSVFAAYNRIPRTDKTMMVLDGLGHDWCPAFDRAAYRWLDRVLGK